MVGREERQGASSDGREAFGQVGDLLLLTLLTLQRRRTQITMAIVDGVVELTVDVCQNSSKARSRLGHVVLELFVSHLAQDAYIRKRRFG